MDKTHVAWASQILEHDFSATAERSRPGNKVFRLTWSSGSAFLKIGKNLESERQRIDWLQSKAPVPKVLGISHIDGNDLLLMTPVKGIDLAHRSNIWSSATIISKLVEALHKFHRIDISDCPFGEHAAGSVLLHGDACLPNFLFHDDESLGGYVDLGDVAVGNREIDLGAGVWSLQFNLGQGHGLQFLRQYGIADADEAMVTRLHDQYERSLLSSLGSLSEIER